MEPSEWMARFRVTHERSKANILNEDQMRDYLGMREELARSLISAQSLQTPDGAPARKHFRVAQMYKIEIATVSQAMTKMVSCSGFSVMMAAEMKVGQEEPFTLTLGRGITAVSGKAKVVSTSKQGQWLISFAITQIADADAERLESALFDAVLARFK
jgi:hypothetical protein